MLEIEIDINQGLRGELATRLMAVWPGLEVETIAEGVRFCLALNENLDYDLGNLETTLQTLEKARALAPLTVKMVNLNGPDAGQEIIRLGRFVIRQPETEVKVRPDQIVLTLIPSPVFGSGGHPSTALTLGAMEDFFSDLPGRPSKSASHVLDVGTGSGILALAAARLGTGPITAIDSLPEAVEAAGRNIELNQLTDRIDVSLISVDKVSGEFDLILANLVPSVLLKAGKSMAGLLKPGGTLIVAGFADTQTPQVLKALTKAGAVMYKSYSRAGWSALAAGKPDSESPFH